MNSEPAVQIKSGIVCPACYSSRVDDGAKQCEVCGKLLSEGFQPLDAIRSSSGMQREKLDFLAERQNPESLFGDTRPLVSNAAWACTVYSMVPYLGLLFVPLAIAFGWLGYLKDRRLRGSDEARATLVPLALSLILLSVQIVLWWLLYLIPKIGI